MAERQGKISLMKNPTLGALAVAMALACTLSAADGPIVIKAARMFDGKSDRIVSPGLIVVDGGKIAGVGASAKVPAGAQIIDLGDATLLPGFMDAHTHLSDPYHADYRQGEMDLLKKPVAERALIASEIARITLMAGFTTVRDVGSEDLSTSACATPSMRARLSGRACWCRCARWARPAAIAIRRPDSSPTCSGMKRESPMASSMAPTRRAAPSATTLNTAPM